MHIATATICLAGDIGQKVVRGEFDPISWPEVDILRAVHGDAAILDVKVFASVEQTAKNEKARLSYLYGVDVVENVFPGKNPQMELEAAGAKFSPPTAWRNPLTHETHMPEVEEEAHEEAPKTKAEAHTPKARVLKPDHTPFA